MGHPIANVEYQQRDVLHEQRAAGSAAGRYVEVQAAQGLMHHQHPRLLVQDLQQPAVLTISSLNHSMESNYVNQVAPKMNASGISRTQEKRVSMW